MNDIQAIRRALREEQSPSLQRRRRIALLSALGLIDFAVISLYQIGVLRHLPDLPGRLFDSDQVNLSPKAFALGGPDGPLGALQYALLLVLASYGGAAHSGRPRWLSLALAATGLAGAGAGLDYLRDMVRQRRACPYCITGAGLNLAIAALSMREALEQMGRGEEHEDGQ